MELPWWWGGAKARGRGVTDVSGRVPLENVDDISQFKQVVITPQKIGDMLVTN